MRGFRMLVDIPRNQSLRCTSAQSNAWVRNDVTKVSVVKIGTGDFLLSKLLRARGVGKVTSWFCDVMLFINRDTWQRRWRNFWSWTLHSCPHATITWSPMVQGSQRPGKSWKTWKMKKAFSRLGKIMEFEKKGQNHGKKHGISEYLYGKIMKKKY